IKDVLSPDTCMCWMDDRCLVQGPWEAALETALPWASSDCITVVPGEHTGQGGQILEREPEQRQALVQLGWDLQVLPLPFGSICYYLGKGKDD
ncbi:GPKOW protein, partial [Spelaeornis formosus]|nr:GPKOW protein [Elachura formosa]